MIIVSYDISDDKLRTKFSKYLCKYGYRMQYSVFAIDNSEKMLSNIITDIKNIYQKRFTQADTVIIFKISAGSQIERFGYAKNEEKDLFII